MAPRVTVGIVVYGSVTENGWYACGLCGGDTTYRDDGLGVAIYYCAACDIAETWEAARAGGVPSPFWCHQREGVGD
jgi:hypothetical protein